jgi:hypothetical protein
MTFRKLVLLQSSGDLCKDKTIRCCVPLSSHRQLSSIRDHSDICYVIYTKGMMFHTFSVGYLSRSSPGVGNLFMFEGRINLAVIK